MAIVRKNFPETITGGTIIETGGTLAMTATDTTAIEDSSNDTPKLSKETPKPTNNSDSKGKIIENSITINHTDIDADLAITSKKTPDTDTKVIPPKKQIAYVGEIIKTPESRSQESASESAPMMLM